MSKLAELFDTYDGIVFFDTETTGLDPAANRIIELAALRIRRGDNGRLEMAGRMDDLILLPMGEKIPEKIAELTHITDTMLRTNGVSETAAAIKFRRMIATMGRRVLLVAHNAQFDLLFTRALLGRVPEGGAKYLDECDYIDSLTVYKDRAPYPHKLADAIEHYDLAGKVKNSHRAIDDVMALYCVFYQMAEERMDLAEYVNTFGYNPKYGIMEPKLAKVAYGAQDYNEGMAAPAATLPAIMKRQAAGEQLTLEDMMKEAAGGK